MATKAAKSITINATKYELANTLGVSAGKMQLKAKDVVLDEAELPAGSKYAVFDFGYEATGFESCKDQDGNDILDSASLKALIEAGGAVYFKYNGQGNNYLEQFIKYRQWIAGDEVKIELTTPISSTTIRKLTCIGTFSVDTPTASITTW